VDTERGSRFHGTLLLNCLRLDEKEHQLHNVELVF